MYEGENLVKPYLPYYYHHEPRRTNPADGRIKRIKTKFAYMGEDFLEYWKDIYFQRTDRFIFKTSTFTQRNTHKVAHTFEHIWEELVKVGQGFKRLNADFKYYLRYHKSGF